MLIIAIVNTLFLHVAVLQAYQVRLAGSNQENHGRVEVQIDGVWGTVCHYSWSIQDAAVVCRMLNLTFDYAIPLYNAAFGKGTGPILMSNVNCEDTDTNLAQCTHFFDAQDCSHNTDAAVICQPDYPTSIQARLAGSNKINQGRVEVRIGGVWGTVCHYGWSTNEASVVCRMLNIPFEVAVPVSWAAFGEGTGAIFMSNVVCNGTETNIAQCRHGFNGKVCGHEKDAAIICLPDSPTDIQARLVGSKKTNQGRLEVQIAGVWGTVCHYEWSTEDAAVVCRMLNIPFVEAIPLKYAAFGQGKGAILMSNVKCNGTETNLAQCSYGFDNKECGHFMDAAIICKQDNTTQRMTETSTMRIKDITTLSSQNTTNVGNTKDSRNLQVYVYIGVSVFVVCLVCVVATVLLIRRKRSLSKPPNVNQYQLQNLEIDSEPVYENSIESNRSVCEGLQHKGGKEHLYRDSVMSTGDVYEEIP